MLGVLRVLICVREVVKGPMTLVGLVVKILTLGLVVSVVLTLLRIIRGPLLLFIMLI